MLTLLLCIAVEASGERPDDSGCDDSSVCLLQGGLFLKKTETSENHPGPLNEHEQTTEIQEVRNRSKLIQSRWTDKKMKQSAVGSLSAADSDSASVVSFSFSPDGSGLPEQNAKLFVDTLRASGYRGHIILGVDPCLQPDVKEFMDARGVLLKAMRTIPCEHRDTEGESLPQRKKCSADHPGQTVEIARFSLAADWINECTTCTGPVVVLDGRDTYFQGDPFATPFHFDSDLELIAEHPGQTTMHWMGAPMDLCYGMKRTAQPMLCSGSIFGTRHGFIAFARQFGEEFEQLMRTKGPECINSVTDQGLLNSLYYGGKLQNAAVAKYREGPVMTMGHPGGAFWRTREPLKGNFGGDIEGSGQELQENYDYVNEASTHESWQAEEMAKLPERLTDDQGRFTNIDGRVCPVIHQWDSFGVPIFRFIEDRGLGVEAQDGVHHSHLKASDVTTCA